ncbi:ABC transporter permease [Micromonospora sp. NPDC048843]|uniref:ABC transporter permease n=1 Tax=Micromonospora sp. NPDC048843 TaxID=3155389 RepID=UPI00340DB241
MSTAVRTPALVTRDWRGSSHAVQFAALTGRALRALVTNRRVALFGLLQPIIMLVLFTQVFGAMADTDAFPHQVAYIDYLLPALMVTTGIGPAVASGSTLVRDMENGLVTRLRALPVSLHWVPTARSLADVTRAAAQVLTLVVTALLVFGFRPAGGFAGVAAAYAVAMLTIWTLVWVFLALASWVRNLEVMQSIGFFVVFPLMFASNAFVPTYLMPGWLQAVTAVNPLSYSIDATRRLALGWPVGTSVVMSVSVCLLLLAITTTLAGRWFRRPPVT